MWADSNRFLAGLSEILAQAMSQVISSVHIWFFDLSYKQPNRVSKLNSYMIFLFIKTQNDHKVWNISIFHSCLCFCLN